MSTSTECNTIPSIMNVNNNTITEESINGYFHSIRKAQSKDDLNEQVIS